MPLRDPGRGALGLAGISLRKLMEITGIYKLYERRLMSEIRGKGMPEHIAVILDGNRRWASERMLPATEGHNHGAKTLEEFLRWCLELGIKIVTVYILSTENLGRSKEEIDNIFRVMEEKLWEMLSSPEIHENRVRVKALGKLSLLPESLRALLNELEEATRAYDNCYFNLAVAYGGRTEIVDAARKIAEMVKDGRIEPSDIDEDLFMKSLYTAHLPKPEPDLIIRTSGEERLSGFLLWQSAYSELCFLDIYWPDFRKIDLLRAIRTYQRRSRRFGK
jgi:tritrans,polycis-undecaprenyl-diphosphate synthase [geranylgeranyl-diphosphate specific]